MLYGSYGKAYITFWDGVSQLPAGCLMRYNGYSLSESCWYNLREEVEHLVLNYREDELRTMLADELRTSVVRSMNDVSSCGLRITGRIESQVLHHIAMNVQQNWKIHTFTGDIDNIGRQPLASPVWVTSLHAVDELERMRHWAEEPFDGCETVVRTAIFRYARRNGVRVVCSGVGLDALWQDIWDNNELRYNKLVPHKMFSHPILRCAMRPTYEQGFAEDADQMRYLDLCYERIPHILRVFDRSAADAGVSVRMPFLDGRLVALSFALPMQCNRRRRSIFESYVAQCHRCAIERGESYSLLPMWRNGGMREWVAEAIDELVRSEVRDWFDVRQLFRLREAFCGKSSFDVVLLWKCLALRCQLSEE
jgi:asparagine synthase (glutamine-hydrolysing)